MDKLLFSGTATALVTPFYDGKVNYPMAEQLLRRQLDAGIRTIVLTGTTGEGSTLSDWEKLELYTRCKQYTGTDCTIIAGTGNNSTERAVKLSMAAENAGADALMVVSPYYNKANEEGLYAHYVSIANAVSIPVIIYNVPSRTGVDIPVAVYQKLAQVSNIAGVKEASSDIRKIIRIRTECPETFSIWAGNDDLAVATAALGGKGVISVLSNVFPKETNKMVHAALCGDLTMAMDLQCALLPMIDLLFCDINPIPVKAAMKLVGFDCGGCRLPLGALSKDNLLKLKAYFANV